MDRYIDSHNHMHALSWDQWEQFAMTGMAGAILSCGNPHVYREIWETPPTAGDILRFWDSPIRMARVSEEKHFMRIRCDKMFYTIMDRIPRDELLARMHIVGREHLDAALDRARCRQL